MNWYKRIKPLFLAVGSVVLIAAAVLFFVQREDKVHLLFAAQGSDFDKAAYDNFQQTLAANVALDKKSLADLSLGQLKKYDAVYLDYTLKQSDTIRASKDKLIEYVRQGGHLFLENGFASDFPADFLGAAQVVDLPSSKNPAFDYPETDLHLKGMQQVFQLFMGNFAELAGFDSIPGFSWGKGIVPSTAESLVTLNNTSIMTVNRAGKGTVLLSSTFLPSHYFITGYDLTGGMDPAAGFSEKIKQFQESYKPQPGQTYFHFKDEQPLKPYFHFAFAAANYQLRNEYLAFVSKERFGYSIKKVLGPYGRPAMAHQNHYEAEDAFQNTEAIQWTELLKTYNQIPSFSLVRSSYNWNKWFEDVTVHLNTGSNQKPEFTGEYANSFYGSGARLNSDGKPLTLLTYPEDRQLSWTIDLPYRTFPALADLDADGKPDLIAGSADGTLVWYKNLGEKPAAYADQPLPAGLKTPDAFGAKQPLLLENGSPLKVSEYAAPAVLDLNADGLPDLVIGGKDGRLLYARNRGNHTFSQPVPLNAGGAPVSAGSYAAPAAGDYDGDGTADLVVGAGDGSVTGFRGVKGKPGVFEAGQLLVKLPSRFAAPSVRDINGDGKPDLVIGSNDGDLQIYTRDADGSWSKQGPVNGNTVNQLGNNAIVGGHNSVPLWYDINHDGKDDLIVGQLEFGLPIPLDNPSFPYAEQLKQFIQYTKDNKLDLYPHVYVHSYVSDAQEKEEIRLHQEMFKKLGIPWKLTGANQHTWRINNNNPLQTLRNENEAGVWFNFGFRPSNDPFDPQYGQDYIWGMPFLLDAPGMKQPLLLHTPSYFLRLQGENYPTEDLYQSYVKLDMPIDYFYHIEYKFPHHTDELLKYVRYLDRIRNEQDYNFMTEPQMAQSFLTALSSKVTVKQSWGTYLLNKLKDKLGKGTHLDLTLEAHSDADKQLAEGYKNTLGVAIERGKPYQSQRFAVNSDIFVQKGSALYTGLERPTRLSVSWKQEPFHLLRSNVPFTIKNGRDQTQIDLLADGMQQIKLYSPVPLAVEGTDLKVEQDEQAKTVTITHFGGKTSVILRKK